MAQARLVTLTIPGLDGEGAQRLKRDLRKQDSSASVAHTSPGPFLDVTEVTLSVRAVKASTAGERAARTVHALLKTYDADARPPLYNVA